MSLVGLEAPYERMWQKGFASPHLSYFRPEALACLARREGLFEVYRGSLDSFAFEGLWQRLRYDRTSSILGSAATWIAITLAGLLLRRLPADVPLQSFMQGGQDQRRWKGSKAHGGLLFVSCGPACAARRLVRASLKSGSRRTASAK